MNHDYKSHDWVCISQVKSSDRKRDLQRENGTPRNKPVWGGSNEPLEFSVNPRGFTERKFLFFRYF